MLQSRDLLGVRALAILDLRRPAIEVLLQRLERPGSLLQPSRQLARVRLGSGELVEPPPELGLPGGERLLPRGQLRSRPLDCRDIVWVREPVLDRREPAPLGAQ